MFSKPGRKSYFGKEIICAHQVEEFAKFIAFRNFCQIYIKVACDRCIRVFTLKYLYDRRELRDKLLYVNIIIGVVRRSVYVANCKCTAQIASVEVDKQTFPDIRSVI